MKSFRCLLILCFFLSVSPLQATYGIGGEVKFSSGGLFRCLVVCFALYAVGSSEGSQGIKEEGIGIISEGIEALWEERSVVGSDTLYSGCDFVGAPLYCEKWRKEVEEMFLWEERYDADLDMPNMTHLIKGPRRLQVEREEGEDYKEVHKRALARFERAMIPLGIVSGLLVFTSGLFIFLGMREDCEKCTKRCACYKSSRCCQRFVRGCCTDPFTCCCGEEESEVSNVKVVNQGETQYHMHEKGIIVLGRTNRQVEKKSQS